MRQHTEGTVGSTTWVLLEIYLAFQQWKNFENSLRIDRVIAMSSVCSFFGPPCTAIRWFVHWPLMVGWLRLVQRGGAWAVSCNKWHYNYLCTRVRRNQCSKCMRQEWQAPRVTIVLQVHHLRIMRRVRRIIEAEKRWSETARHRAMGGQGVAWSQQAVVWGRRWRAVTRLYSITVRRLPVIAVMCSDWRQTILCRARHIYRSHDSTDRHLHAFALCWSI